MSNQDIIQLEREVLEELSKLNNALLTSVRGGWTSSARAIATTIKAQADQWADARDLLEREKEN